MVLNSASLSEFKLLQCTYPRDMASVLTPDEERGALESLKTVVRGLESGQGLVGGASSRTIRQLLAEMSAADGGKDEGVPAAPGPQSKSEVPGVANELASELASDGGVAASYLAGKYAAASSEAAACGEKEKETEMEEEKESKGVAPGRNCGACGAAGATQRCGRCNLVW